MLRVEDADHGAAQLIRKKKRGSVDLPSYG
jgi:hypothetical protein